MIRLTKLKPLPPEPGARERTLARLAQWQRAQAELERVCKEQGIPVPVMVC